MIMGTITKFIVIIQKLENNFHIVKIIKSLLLFTNKIVAPCKHILWEMLSKFYKIVLITLILMEKELKWIMKSKI
jgi:hypothetical protein